MHEWSDEELVIQIQAGETQLMLQLWNQCGRFISFVINRYCVFYEKPGRGLNGCDREDLLQVSYIALDAAVRYFDRETGYKFTTYLYKALINAFDDTVRESRRRGHKRDALNYADSYDTPVSDGEDSTLLEVFLVDESTMGEGSVEDQAVESVYRNNLRDVLDNCLSRLPDREGLILRKHYYEDIALQDIAGQCGVTLSAISASKQNALRTLYLERYTNGLEKFLDEHTDYYRGTGFQQFKNSQISAVENIVFRREELTLQWMRAHLKAKERDYYDK